MHNIFNFSFVKVKKLQPLFKVGIEKEGFRKLSNKLFKYKILISLVYLRGHFCLMLP